jgi:general nucleoside transport system ATP-binding protein
MDQSNDIVLNMQAITKNFPGVLACDKVDFELRKGEVHGLLGENGAGKSTLMNLLYGLHHMDSGKIYLDGKEVTIQSPKVARELGIGMVHQHFMLIENLTAMENVILGLPLERPPLLDLEKARERFVELSDEYDLNLNPATPVWQLPVGSQQWLEILKLLFLDTRVLILDEPTAVLTPSHAQKLFKTIKRFTEEGRSIIFISHKLEEIKQIADRVTVMRDGYVVGTLPVRDAKPAQLAQMMVGRSVVLERLQRQPVESKPKVLEIENLNCYNDHGTLAIKDFNLTVFSGEIVGVAGVDGNGQRELAECIAGLRHPTNGTIHIEGKIVEDVIHDSSLLGYVPEDRRKTGLVLNFSVAENLVMKLFSKHPFTKRNLMKWDEIRNWSNSLIQEYDIRTPNSRVPVKTLSGGNQQKVIIARETSNKPSLLLTSQPTRGLDLGAVESVHKILLNERNRGAAVVFISTELPEVLALSDRIIVMFKGQLIGELEAENADINTIGEWMLGHRVTPEEAISGTPITIETNE